MFLTFTKQRNLQKLQVVEHKKKIPIPSNQSEIWVAMEINALKLLNTFLFLWAVNTQISVVSMC